jgi:hypothetical protein
VINGRKLTNGKSKRDMIWVSFGTGVAAFPFLDGINNAMKILSKNNIEKVTKYKIRKDRFFNIELLLLGTFNYD